MGWWSQLGRDMRRDWAYYVLLIPGIAFYIIFKYVPMYGVVIAFKDYGIFKGIWESEWVGMQWFTQLFTSSDFVEILRNTVLISGYKLLFGFPAPIILALLLFDITSTRFRKAIQTITYLPHFLSWVIFGGILVTILTPSTGLIGYVFRLFGADAPQLIGDPKWFRTLLVVSDIWKEVGYSCIIYLAALAGVDPTLYEAAAIDGAGRWRRLWNVTIPSIAGTIAVVLILRLGNVLDAGFEQVFVLYGPTTYEVGDIIDTWVYRVGLGMRQYGLATAAGLFKAGIGFCLMMITNYWARRAGGKGIW